MKHKKVSKKRKKSVDIRPGVVVILSSAQESERKRTLKIEQRRKKRNPRFKRVKYSSNKRNAEFASEELEGLDWYGHVND